jgi:hypothetical protein
MKINFHKGNEVDNICALCQQTNLAFHKFLQHPVRRQHKQ